MWYLYFVEFWHSILLFTNFSFGIVVLDTPQSLFLGRLLTDKSCDLFWIFMSESLNYRLITILTNIYIL